MVDQNSSTTQTSQQSSSQQSQSTQQSAADGGASSPTRPDYVPESFWDAGTNAVKGAEFGKHIADLTALKAAQDARIAARPEKPGGYELKFNETFKPDVALKFDENDQRVAPLRAYAHANNLSQAEFSGLLEIEAGRVLAETKAYNDAVAAETKKLGANATARVTALKTWLGGILGAKAATDLLGDEKTAGLVVFSADAVNHLEKLQLAYGNQSGGQFQQNGRTTPEPKPQRIADILYGQPTKG